MSRISHTSIVADNTGLTTFCTSSSAATSTIARYPGLIFGPLDVAVSRTHSSLSPGKTTTACSERNGLRSAAIWVEEGGFALHVRLMRTDEVDVEARGHINSKEKIAQIAESSDVREAITISLVGRNGNGLLRLRGF